MTAHATKLNDIQDQLYDMEIRQMMRQDQLLHQQNRNNTLNNTQNLIYVGQDSGQINYWIDANEIYVKNGINFRIIGQTKLPQYINNKVYF